MPRKKQQSSEVMTGEIVDTPSIDVQSAPAEKVNRISIPLAPDGTIDYASMRESTREKLKSAIGSSAFPSAGDPAAPSVIEINMDFIPYMYGMMTMGIQLGGKKFLNWPDGLTKHIRFNDDELEALKEPTAKVIKKYSNKLTFWLRHQDEFALLQVLLISSKTMVERAAMLYVQEVRAAQPAETTEPLPGEPVRSA